MKNEKNSKTVCMLGYTDSIHFWRWSEFLKKAGFNVVVVSFVKNDFYDDYKKNILKYYDLSAGSKNKIIKSITIFLNLFKAVKIINKSKFDFINFHFIEMYQFFISSFINKRIILSCWGSDILIDYKNSWFIKKKLYEKIFKKAYLITMDSETVKKTIIERYRAVDKNKFRIIYWGIDEKMFIKPDKKEKDKLKKKFNLPADSIVILCIRNLTKVYRVKEIINWFNKKIRDENFYLFVRVPPKSDKKYIDGCKVYACGNSRIIFNEEKTKYQDINKFYKLSDVSLHYPASDASPVSMLEAVSSGHAICGRPGISSYQVLAEEYKNINLLKLEDLSTNLLRKLVKNKKKNFLKYHHTSRSSIEKLKEVMP